MKDWENTLISPSTAVLEVIQLIESSAQQIALIVDEKRKLLGTVTDGDIRRAILKDIKFDEPVKKIMNQHPTVGSPDEDSGSNLKLMQSKLFHHLPLVDSQGIVVGLETLENFMLNRDQDNWIVLMAGGLGSRLYPLTKDRPKPMIQVGEKPILEIILENCIASGFSKVFISINYKAEIIKEYFQDGKKWGVEIQYIHEKERMGTAGALYLLPQKPEKTFLVMNCDLITSIDLKNVLHFHSQQKVSATMCVRDYQFQVPYGVVEIEDQRILKINEKPVQRFFINAGIYALEPEVLNLVKQETFIDMTEVFKNLIAKNESTAVFPIREYWLDVGQVDDLRQANQDIKNKNF
jgi:dTDP-glucose pyrophosphorylase/predicted transcriptional regulator